MAHVGLNAGFWAGRRVLVTGHTGFKGAWLTLWLRCLGAEVCGLSSSVPTTPSLYGLADVGRGVTEVRADVRDAGAVAAAMGAQRPEVVIHMAAQPIVRRSFHEPRETYEVNVMGTVNVLDAVRTTPGVLAVVNVTSDKCYDNPAEREPRPFREDDPKGGHDPYSSSKGCAELVAEAYGRSFFLRRSDGPRLGSARAGNVIGGGDWGEDRLIPDVMNAAISDRPIRIRNPEAVRPWQHVLNPLSGYLKLAESLAGSVGFEGGWNFGPAASDVQTVRWIAERIGERWDRPLTWELDPGPHPHEAHYLALDSSKARDRLGWTPAWDLAAGLGAVVEWHRALRDGADLRRTTLAQIEEFTDAAR